MHARKNEAVGLGHSPAVEHLLSTHEALGLTPHFFLQSNPTLGSCKELVLPIGPLTHLVKQMGTMGSQTSFDSVSQGVQMNRFSKSFLHQSTGKDS